MKFFYLIIYASVLAGCSGAKEMKIEKPSYYLKLEMENCPRLLTINGIEVERDFSGQTSYAEYPVNHYIKNGENFFELMIGSEEYMKEAAENGSKCVVQLRVRGFIEEKKVDYIVTDIAYTPNYTGNNSDLIKTSLPSGRFKYSSDGSTTTADSDADFNVGEIVFAPLWHGNADGNFRRTFEAKVPFPEWEFFDADSVILPFKSDDEYDSAEAKILPHIYKLREMFNNKELDKIMPLFEMRSNEIDQAFYKKSGETQSELRQSIERVFSKNLPLSTFTEENKQLVINYEGKLFGIVDAGNMAGTISFWNEDADMFITYTIYWMIKDGKWIIAR